MLEQTIFECRTCGNGCRGYVDGSFTAVGWCRILHIDGPNAMCPTCARDPNALQGLRRDGYKPEVVIGTSTLLPVPFPPGHEPSIEWWDVVAGVRLDPGQARQLGL